MNFNEDHHIQNDGTSFIKVEDKGGEFHPVLSTPVQSGSARDLGIFPQSIPPRFYDEEYYAQNRQSNTPARLNGAAGGGGGDSGDGDDGDDGDDSDSHNGLGRSNRPDPRNSYGVRQAPFEFQNQGRLNVISHEHQSFTLTEVNSKTLSDFQSNCNNALLVEPGFNSVTRISAKIMDSMVAQENRNALKSNLTSTGVPAWGSTPLFTRNSLFKLGTEGKLGLSKIIAILVSMLGPASHWQEDIIKAFRAYQPSGCDINDLKKFHKNMTDLYVTYFQILGIQCSKDLSRTIITEREAMLRSVCFRNGNTIHNGHSRFVSTITTAKEANTDVFNIPIWLQILDYSFVEFEEALPYTGERKSSVGNMHAGRANSDNRNSDRKDRGRDRSQRRPEVPYQAYEPNPARPKSGNSTAPRQASRSTSPAPVSAPSADSVCFQCGKPGLKSGHSGCTHPDEPNARGRAALEAYREKARRARDTRHPNAMATVTPVPKKSYAAAASRGKKEEKVVSFSMATISRFTNSALEVEDSDSELESDDEHYEDIPIDILCPRHPPIHPLPFNRVSTVEFVSNVTIQGTLSTCLWDTAACNGNWITASEVERLNLVKEKAKKQVYTSPLFPEKTFESVHVVYLDVDFDSMGFSILQIACRILEDNPAKAQAPIIFGQDLISTYGILNYIVKPYQYHAISRPEAAPEEMYDNPSDCVLPFAAAMLDASGLPTSYLDRNHSVASIEEKYDFDSVNHIHKDFPLRARALKILNYYDSKVYVDKLNNSTINYPPMKAELLKPFHGVPPRRMNATKQAFLEKWIHSAIERKLIRPSNSRYTSPLLLVPKPPDAFRVTQDVSVLMFGSKIPAAGALAAGSGRVPEVPVEIGQISTSTASLRPGVSTGGGS